MAETPSVMLLDVPAGRLLPGVRLRHHGGSEWLVVEDIGGVHGDYRIECVGDGPGEKVGNSMVVHAEYVPRSFKVVMRVDFEWPSGGGARG